MRAQTYLSVFISLLLTACGQADGAASSLIPRPAEILSTDFAVMSCSEKELPAECAFIMAGGKRVIFGAPAGIGSGLSEEDLRNLDALMLLSLRGEGVEGLDEVRNASWKAGHGGPLPVAGPFGTADFIGGLNRAFETSDALIFVEDRPAGGFDAALLALLPGEKGRQVIVLDTGDLQVTRIESGSSRAIYLVDYAEHRVLLHPCGAGPVDAFMDGVDFALTCETGWEFEAPHFVMRQEADMAESAPE